MAQYTLANLAVNSNTDNGSQQISVRPYKEVTSLNVNQLLDDIVDHGASKCNVSFDIGSSATELEITVGAGFTTYFRENVVETVDDVPVSRTYIVKVAFEEDSTYVMSRDLILPAATLPSDVFKNQDKGSLIGVASPTSKQVYLILKYNWEEGMLAGTGGTGAGSIGTFARLGISTAPPHTEVSSNLSRFEKTIYLGELLNLGNALQSNVGSYEFIPSLVEFRQQPLGQGLANVFDNLRNANKNFRIDFNPSMDWLYVSSGKCFLGSSVLQIPEGFCYRSRVVTPAALLETDADVKLEILSTSVNFDDTSGQPVTGGTEGTPPETWLTSGGTPISTPVGEPADDDVLGQYDVLVMGSSGEIGWIIRPYTALEESEAMDPLTDAETYTGDTIYRKLSQVPGWDGSEETTTPQVDNVLSKISLALTKPYLILAVYKRIYYDDGGVLKLPTSLLPHSSVTDRNYIIYEHNPLFPALSVPDTSSEAIITDTLVIPVEEV